MLKEEAEIEAEEMEGVDDLSAGDVGQTHYEEPGPRGSAAVFYRAWKWREIRWAGRVWKWREIRWAGRRWRWVLRM